MRARTPSQGLFWRVCALVAAGLLLVVSGLAYAYGTGRLNALLCGGQCGPAAVAAPATLRMPGGPTAGSADQPLPSRLDADAVRAALDQPLAAASLGPHVAVAVADLSGRVVVLGAQDAFAPASTAKVLTSFAALRLLGPEHRFETSVVQNAPDHIVLVGGGDPYLDTVAHAGSHAASLAELARLTAAKLRAEGVSSVYLGYDASLFAGPALSPTWERKYSTDDVVTPIHALWVDGGEHGVRDRDPVLVAAQRFAALLRRDGIVVDGTVADRASRDARPIARVKSRTVRHIIEELVRYSDNEAAEVIARQVALAAGEPVTFEGAATAVIGQLRAAGIDTDGVQLHDGSGLSRADRVPPKVLATVLAMAARDPATAGLFAALPIAGVDGTLTRRFAADSAARGLVRAKTGTLTGVHALAGVVQTADGRVLTFAALADSTSKAKRGEVEVALDHVAAALAGCRCGSGQ